MSDYIFLFDLDSTITKKEILSEISLKFNKSDEIKEITEATMKGEIPFKTSFLRRVSLLSDISVKDINDLIANIPLNTYIVEFIKLNLERCYIVTGNLDVWISELIKKIGLEKHCYCSKADVVNDRISKIVSVIDKELTAKQFVQPLVSIGDGDNDSGMAHIADIGIGFGAVRKIAPSLLRNCDFAFYDDSRCADFLWELL